MADRTLTVKIVGDESDLLRSFQRSTRATKTFSVGVGSILKGAAIGAGITAAVTGVTAALRAGISEFSEMTKVSAQTQAALKSTGGVANVTAKDIDRLAGSISQMSGIDDEAIAGAENLLLTFKNVRNEVGQGNRVFDRATKAATDLSVAGFGSLDSTAKQLGKALNDPLRGITALSRAGVTFSRGQVKQIKGLVASNKLLEAQRIILKEVESQVGGSAKALGDTLPGQLNRLRNSLRDTAGDLVGAVAPAFTEVIESTNEFIRRLSEARGARAKLSVVFEGVETIGRQLFQQIEEVFRRVDWPRLIEDVQAGLLEGLSRLGKALGKVNYGEVGRQVGRGLVRSLNGIVAFLENADFEAIGRTIVRSISDFLKNVDWQAVLVGAIRLLVAATRAVVSLAFGIGVELGSALVNGLKAALQGLAGEVGGILSSAFAKLKEIATRAVLQIIEPFTHLPAFLGSQFREAKDALLKGLGELEETVNKRPPVRFRDVFPQQPTDRLPRNATAGGGGARDRRPVPGGDRAAERPNVNINSVTVVANDADGFLRDLQKKAGRTTATARGRFPGRSLGLS